MCEKCRHELPKNYNPQEADRRIYADWENNGYFRAVIDAERQPFTIVMPPPNITGQLHLGHALNNTMQDIIIRYKRMQGYVACWMPGTDHASIATEAKIVEAMAKEGISKADLTRDQFLERAWQWKKEYGGCIVSQLRRLGVSCDWDRERFTMDDGMSAAVNRVFVNLYNKGLIYRGERMVNYCPYCTTSISDAEVEYEDQATKLCHVRYPLADGDGYLIVATTRPETMLGDTAVAVHPDDERYKHLIGKEVILPLVNRKIPIVADEYVKMEFGTGVVKITPAHDPNDFEVGRRHNLPIIDTFTDDGHLYAAAGKYAGMDFMTARRAMLEDLAKLDLIEKMEDYTHAVGTCYRCHTNVEPKVSLQWFVKMPPLAEPALQAVRDGSIKFVPERFSKIYYNWMENIKDWCISRQLWWGHRIPAWYCAACGKTTVSETEPKVCAHCGATELHQDPDTLDTWFSSALWPFAGFGWPEKTDDLKYFYPTDVLVTAYDIIFFWVARMIFSALAQTEQPPFHTVLIHGLVRDSQGRKMSKSLGNGIDPLGVIDRYGADALRYSLIQGNSQGNDFRYQEEKVEAGRAFVNKIWNATRFVLMNFPKDYTGKHDPSKFLPEDAWILSRLQQVIGEINQNMDKYELGIALAKIYNFIWEEFCDWYIEMVKPRMNDAAAPSRDEAFYVLNEVVTAVLKLLHPFMPFVTEELYKSLPLSEPTIMLSKWPQVQPDLIKPELEEQMSGLMDAIRQIRNLRLKLNVPFSHKAALIIVPQKRETGEVFAQGLGYLQRMAAVSTLTVKDSKEGIPASAVTAVFAGGEIFIPLQELVDIEQETLRLQKEEEKLLQEVKGFELKLNNEGFVSRAPAKVVEGERAKLAKAAAMLANVRERIKALQEL